jgi:flavin reductase (DIM6/NTAB) family NADH-FMN oxidoreductase RutF
MSDVSFINISPGLITENPFELIDKEWMLITAGEPASFNTMTASWGGFGILWNKPVVFCFIRPVRYTYQFIEKADFFTATFFDRTFRKALNFCGANSGRDVDKMAATGLIPKASPNGSVYFEQARLVLECRKLYYSDIDPKHFLIPGINKNYPKADFHRMYIGEIVSCMQREKQT